MTVRRGSAAAIALVWVALAAAGCGLGPGEEVGEVKLTVTRDYGASLLLMERDGASESDTVMRVLERNAEIETRYGGGFVQAIDGLEADREDGRYWDWLYYVNGIEATVGAADYELRSGEAIWWDYRDWSEALRVPAVVGSYPEPFVGGYDGEQHPVVVECRGGGLACDAVGARLEGTGVSVSKGSRSEDAIRVLVGPWDRVRKDAAAAEIEDGVQASGVFADFVPQGLGFELRGLDENGEPARRFGPGAGLVAATRRFDAPPVWVVTGLAEPGVVAAAQLLNPADLRDHYAVATEGGEETSLPLRVR
jgi:Domain of unknown function (DUF4430)